MSTRLTPRQREAVIRALLLARPDATREAVEAEVLEGSHDAHPAAGAPQGRPFVTGEERSVRMDIYPKARERDEIKARVAQAGEKRGRKVSPTQWLMEAAGLREEK